MRCAGAAKSADSERRLIGRSEQRDPFFSKLSLLTGPEGVVRLTTVVVETKGAQICAPL
jgi:hypothetical protein